MADKRYAAFFLAFAFICLMTFLAGAARAQPDGMAGNGPCEGDGDFAVQTFPDDFVYPPSWNRQNASADPIQLSADLPCPVQQWTVTGTGASINNSGLLSMSSNACGGYTAIARDSCGNTQEIKGELGHWVSDCSAGWSAQTCCMSTTQTFNMGSVKLVMRKQCHWYPYNNFIFSCGGYTAQDFGDQCSVCSDKECKYTNVAIRVWRWVGGCL